RTVTEEREHGRVTVVVTGADAPVALQAHRVTGGVQRLRADDDGVETEAGLDRIPSTVVGAAEQTDDVHRVDVPAPRDTVLTIGREDVVVRTYRVHRTDLRGLLPEQ